MSCPLRAMPSFSLSLSLLVVEGASEKEEEGGNSCRTGRNKAGAERERKDIYMYAQCRVK